MNENPERGNFAIPSNGAATAALMAKTMRLENLACEATVRNHAGVFTQAANAGGMSARLELAADELPRQSLAAPITWFGSTYPLWPPPYQPTRAAKFMRFALRLAANSLSRAHLFFASIFEK